MNTFTSRILAAIAATTLSLSVATSASATGSLIDVNDVLYACTHATTEIKDLTILEKLGPLQNVQIVYLDEVLNDAEVGGILSNITVALNKITLQNFLNSNADDLDVVDNDGTITVLQDVLNSNDIDVSDVVGINVSDNVVTLFCDCD
jgi:hypothetical protein